MVSMVVGPVDCRTLTMLHAYVPSETSPSLMYDRPSPEKMTRLFNVRFLAEIFRLSWTR